jgi:hypothetical protein
MALASHAIQYVNAVVFHRNRDLRTPQHVDGAGSSTPQSAQSCSAKGNFFVSFFISSSGLPSARSFLFCFPLSSLFFGHILNSEGLLRPLDPYQCNNVHPRLSHPPRENSPPSPRTH